CQTPLATPVAPTPGGGCDGSLGGLDRPAGFVPPGYIYEPTSFNGTIQDPQPDDTFAADAPGHAAYAGRLTTRVHNGREEFLVCPHVGSNVPDFWFTPFPSKKPVPHDPTISARVIITDAAGHKSIFAPFTAGITDSGIFHYDGSKDVREGYLRIWVPFTARTG